MVAILPRLASDALGHWRSQLTNKISRVRRLKLLRPYFFDARLHLVFQPKLELHFMNLIAAYKRVSCNPSAGVKCHWPRFRHSLYFFRNESGIKCTGSHALSPGGAHRASEAI